MPTLYHYDKNGLYTHSSSARLSPRDLAQSKVVPLVPKNATLVALPEYDEDTELVRFNTTKKNWAIEAKPPANFIEIVTSERLYFETLQKSIQGAFSEATVTITPTINTELAAEKTVLADNVSATADNIATIEQIIATHDYVAAKLAWIRTERTARISETEWIRARHEDELELVVTAGLLAQTTLTSEQYTAWLVYWQALRDFPATCDPLNLVWPSEPEV